MPISEGTYERVALEDPENQWELVRGQLRPKPLMTAEHNQIGRMLTILLGMQLDLRQYIVGANAARLRISNGNHYVPDVCVIPMQMWQRLHERPGTFEVYDDPMPLVVEIWSPSTGAYDVQTKLAEYQLRFDTEIWRIHPYDRTLTAYRLQSDGGYRETIHTGGSISPTALPGVTIDIERLWS